MTAKKAKKKSVGLKKRVAKVDKRGQITLSKKLRQLSGFPTSGDCWVFLIPNLAKHEIIIRFLGVDEDVMSIFEKMAKERSKE